MEIDGKVENDPTK